VPFVASVLWCSAFWACVGAEKPSAYYNAPHSQKLPEAKTSPRRFFVVWSGQPMGEVIENEEK
jgi:hypothetical protein